MGIARVSLVDIRKWFLLNRLNLFVNNCPFFSFHISILNDLLKIFRKLWIYDWQLFGWLIWLASPWVIVSSPFHPPPSHSKPTEKRTDWKKWNGGCSTDVSSIKELIRSFTGKTRPAPYRRDAALRNIQWWLYEPILENMFELDSLTGRFFSLKKI